MAAGTLLGRAVLVKAQRVLNDLHASNWPLDELVDWGNEAQRQIALLRPDASAEYKDMACVAGSVQSLPPGSIRLLDVLCNVGGRSITYIDRAILDADNPDWRTDTASATMKHWMLDERIPDKFICYPAQPQSPGNVTIARSVLPTAFTLNNVNGASVDSVIGIPDVFESPMINYMVFRSYSKDAEYTVRGGKAELSWNLFLQSLGLQLDTDRRFSPESNTPPKRTTKSAGKVGAFQR